MNNGAGDETAVDDAEYIPSWPATICHVSLPPPTRHIVAGERDQVRPAPDASRNIPAMTRFITIFAATLILTCLFPLGAGANCNSCYLPRVNRDRTWSLGADRKGFFADVRVEYQDWETKSSVPDDDASAGHGDGHPAAHSADPVSADHSHNRSRERYTHLTLGANVFDGVTLLAHTPYVERFELTDEGVDSFSGVGDTDLVGIWRFLRFPAGYLGGLAGAKLPAGDSRRRDHEGERIQPELQPGTGSFDATAGPVFEWQAAPFILRGNALYFLRTGGSQDYSFGDSVSVSVFADYVALESKEWSLFVGADANLQSLGRDRRDAASVPDSGGTLLFLGPSVTLRVGEHGLLSASLLLPAVQNRNGGHQDLDRIVTVGGRVLF